MYLNRYNREVGAKYRKNHIPHVELSVTFVVPIDDIPELVEDIKNKTKDAEEFLLITAEDLEGLAKKNYSYKAEIKSTHVATKHIDCQDSRVQT